MAKKEAVKGKGVEARKAAQSKPRKTATKRTLKARRAKQPGKIAKKKPSGRKTVQPRVWRRMARLADDALVSLQQGNTVEVRLHLKAIRAVALCTDEQQR